ncbi:uncharacterized protein N7459_008409 [Penicillium hispanicum]|uniref:uncharacterized protein n=1 Tax=Penicillium hispanicum TaxID=1080232 RepID=UPI0025413109|nr:uncharacterized protein N7459_008409 [Penicillium hispanicum]KAJ5573982.1 hypothetical protein N7459_008409 [Penicillium hispanicum]
MTDTILDQDATKLLDALASVLPHTKYREDIRGNREYDHEGVSPYVKPLLTAIGLKDWGFTVWMFYTSFRWGDLPGPVNVIPVCNVTESAMSEPGGELKYGLMRRIDGHVIAKPQFAAVFAVPHVPS